MLEGLAVERDHLIYGAIVDQKLSHCFCVNVSNGYFSSDIMACYRRLLVLN